MKNTTKAPDQVHPAADPQSPKKATRGLRSPNFPIVSLKEAIEKVRVLYDKDRRSPMTPSVVLEHLGYARKKSGTAGRVVSALRQFGLLDIENGMYKGSD